MILPTLLATTVFRIDFAHWGGTPLLKTKFGVYQTPLISKDKLLASIPLLKELGVGDFRYEVGWGKPDVLAHDMVGGTAERPTYDFTVIDALVSGLRKAGVRPLFANTYCPNPLKSRTPWDAWKDVPNDLEAWSRINRDFVAHLRAKGLRAPFYEVWNEPDIPEPNGKIFFNGGPEDYLRVYDHGVRGIRAGDPDASAGGPAAAYDLRFLKPILARNLPLDFASIHAYDNFDELLGAMRGLLRDRPGTPMLLTEYASYKEFGLDKPNSRAGSAARFFRDVHGLLRHTDTPKVYWAQWVDDDLGLITMDGRRKALFNAFKLYGSMPTDRVRVQPAPMPEIGVLASADEREATVAVYNAGGEDRSVTLRFDALPFEGRWEILRIDRRHASPIDDPASGALRAEPLETAGSAWTGTVPSEGVAFLRLRKPGAASRPAPKPIGTLVRDHFWFPNRGGDAYSDFDLRNGEARLGTGSKGAPLVRIGAEVERPAPCWRVNLRRQGPDGNPEMALRFGKTLVPVPVRTDFTVDLRRLAPKGWNGRRVDVQLLLRNARPGAGARFRFTPY